MLLQGFKNQQADVASVEKTSIHNTGTFCIHWVEKFIRVHERIPKVNEYLVTSRMPNPFSHCNLFPSNCVQWFTLHGHQRI
uniref:Uncharacterized protein n=1 Tax=Anguilla anguilla TaxID=7936 RepID=A0A0E9TDH5_ANGAN